jgi:hypothetical protein
MKRIKICYLFFLIVLNSCDWLFSADPEFKNKIFHQQIDSGKAIKTILGSGGDFDLVYKNINNKVDTIYIGGYPALIDDIDTSTILYKDSLNNNLRLENLKNEHGGRYTRTIDLLLYFN